MKKLGDKHPLKSILVRENDKHCVYKHKHFFMYSFAGQQYNIVLRHAQDWPLVCINAQKKTYLPLELCSVKLQKDPSGRLDERSRVTVGDQMAMPPGNRRQLIDYFAQHAYDNNEILKHYGISSGLEMRTVQAVVLPPPKMRYGNNVSDPKIFMCGPIHVIYHAYVSHASVMHVISRVYL